MRPNSFIALALVPAALLLTACEEETALPPTERVQDVDDAPNPEENVVDTPAPDVDAPPAMEENTVPADSVTPEDGGVQG